MYFRRLSLALLTLLLGVSPLFAQAAKNAGTWSEWETITPEGEEFTVTMPKNPTTETAKFPYHKMELNTRLYLARSTAGPVLAIASFSGIKSSPMYTEFARFNSYIDELMRAGKLLPVQRDAALGLLRSAAKFGMNAVVEAFFEGSPVKVSFGEIARSSCNTPGIPIEEAEFYSQHFPDLAIDEIAKRRIA